VLTRSGNHAARSTRGQRTECSSRASISVARRSEDSFYPERQAPTDPAVVERSLQRRRILEELVRTEEGYIADLRFLINASFPLGNGGDVFESDQIAGLCHYPRVPTSFSS
jgi:hypothetical protein